MTTERRTAPPTAVPEVLERSRVLIEPELRTIVGGLNPDVGAAIGYHLGWWNVDGTPIAGGGGKGIRPALAILSAEAAGARAAVGVPGAVAIELVHNFSLLHDDVIDGDHERRHRPTVWTVYGVGSAIIAGDALLTLALRVILDAGPGDSAAAARALVVATEAMITGQAADIASETRLDLSVEECVEMEGAKTGALLACAASVGAILAGADAASITALSEYGQHLGVAFQAVDDLLGIWGDPTVTGKPTWSDLRSRKKTLPIVHALTGGHDAAQPLRELFSRDELSESQIARAAQLIEEAGGRELTEAAAETHYQRALAALQTADLEPGAHRELVEVARFVTTREH